MKFEKLILEEIEHKISGELIKGEGHNILDNQLVNHHNNNIVDDNEYTYNYTHNSAKMSDNLWSHKSGGKIEPEYLRRINVINKNLDNTKPASEDMTVYSGVRKDPQKLLKDSGGILHHAALMSTSINPSLALTFTNSDMTDRVRHVLKIKIRKGQKVGGYIGEKSAYPSEREYLLKANQLLAIHPTYHSYTGNDGREVRVHHAIVLEPHEYSNLGEHKELQTFKSMSNELNNESKAHDKHIDKLIDDGKVDNEYISKNSELHLNSSHIDKLLDKPELHQALLSKYQLNKNQLDKVFSAGVAHPHYLSKQKNLSKEHIDKLISLNDKFTNINLINNKMIKLEKPFVDKLSVEKTYHEYLSNSNHIDGSHIDKMINSDDRDVIENLSKRDDLSENHINKLAEIKDLTINDNLSRNTNLSSENISKILERGDNHYTTNVGLSSKKNLTPEHISELFKDKSNFRRLIVSNVMENHKLSDEHKKIAKEILNNGVHIPHLTESVFEGVILRRIKKAVV